MTAPRIESLLESMARATLDARAIVDALPLCPPCADLGTCGPACPGDDYEDEYGPARLTSLDCPYPGFDYSPSLEDGPDEIPQEKEEPCQE